MTFTVYPAGTQLTDPSGKTIVSDGKTEYNSDYYSSGSSNSGSSSGSGNFLVDLKKQIQNGQISQDSARSQLQNYVMQNGASQQDYESAGNQLGLSNLGTLPRTGTQNVNSNSSISGGTSSSSTMQNMPDGFYNVGGAYFQKQGGTVSAVSDPTALRNLQNGGIHSNTASYGDLLAAHQSGPDPISSGLPPTGSSKLDSILQGLSSYVSGQLTQGFSVNPNIQITPDLVSKFISQAHQTIDPYYQQQLTGEITNINANLDTLSKQYQLDQADSQAKFQQDVANEREAAAGGGTAFSGSRGLNENLMLGAQNRTLGALDTGYAQRIGELARAGGANLGAGIPGLTGSAGSFNLPTLSTQTASLSGPRGGSVTGGNLSLNFDPSLYKYGAIPENYGSDVTGQSNQYLSSYLKSAGNNSARSFSNVNGVPTLL